MRLFEWLRFPGDAFFLVGVLAVLYLTLRMFANRNRLRTEQRQT